MTEKIKIQTKSGKIVDAVAPVIISASRSTDIPAFYAQWFINRLEAGYCVWYNPFNQKPTYVSFENCKVVVFWTKNPRPLMSLLHKLDERGIHYYFQYTLNDYDDESFEPNVPDVSKRVATFIELSNLVGHGRVIWRFDPLIITPELTPRDLLKKIWKVGNLLKGHTDKLVFSFVDVNAYRKVQNNLIKRTNHYTKESIRSAELSLSQMEEIADGLMKCKARWEEEGWHLSIATCSEKIDLEEFNIEHNRCVDGALIEELWPEDKELIYFLHTGRLPQNSLFGEIEIPPLKKDFKDKGQRALCGCMVSKDIGMYNTCNHLCVYCYANTSDEQVAKNINKHDIDSESIIK